MQRILINTHKNKESTLARLKKQNIKVLAEYPGLVLVNASRRQRQKLQDKNIRFSSCSDRCLRVNGVKVDHTQLQNLSEEMKIPESKMLEAGFHLLALVGPVLPEWKKKISSLGSIVQALPGYGFIVKVDSDSLKALKGLEFVAWVEPYHPGFKLGSYLFGCPARKQNLGNILPKNILAKSLPFGEVEVSFFKGEDPKKAISQVEKLGGQVLSAGRRLLRVKAKAKLLPVLATIEGVSRIDSYKPESYDNDQSATILKTDDVRDSHELDGEGQIVAIVDTGLDTGVDDGTMHQDFQGRITEFVTLGSESDAIDDEGHGTHVAGTAVGDGTASGGTYSGMAPEASILVIKKPGSIDLDEMEDGFTETYDRDCRIQNNSWGKNDNAAYDTWSTSIDEFIWDNRDFLPLFSAGNDGEDSDGDGIADLGSLRSTGSAKNCLTVGGCENGRTELSTPTPGRNGSYDEIYWWEGLSEPIASDHFSDTTDGMFYHSSRGPTDDGRIKPDIVAPGSNVLSTRTSATSDLEDTLLTDPLDPADPLEPLYQWSSGTSMSTPAVTGCVALARQYLIDQRGHERTDDHPRPSAALLKAMIINGAADMPGQYTPDETGAAPNPNEGWGRVDIEQSLFPESTGRVQFSDSPEYAMQTGESREFHVHVHDNSEPLKATLVWTDAAGSGIINELYLRVEEPDGTIHDGDFNDDGTSNPYDTIGAEGVQNNVQQVIIESPQEGTHTIHVIAVNVSEGMDPSPRDDLDPSDPVQDFALAVSNATGYSKQPVSIMQVIDRSGSMAYYGYMEPAKQRAEALTDIVQINDKIGLASFNSTASLDSSLDIVSSHEDKEDVQDAIDTLSSSGNTSIGAGIELAQSQFTSDGLPHAIVLLSDGFSNTAPYAIDPTDGSDPIVNEEFIDSGTVIYTVALGATADADRLEDIAVATSGEFFEISGYSDLNKLHEIYYNIQALATGDEIVELDSDGIPEGETNSHTAEVDGETEEAFFGMSSESEEEDSDSDEDVDSLHLTLVDPDGYLYTPSTKEVQYREGNSFRYYRVTKPKAGTWCLNVERKASLGAKAVATKTTEKQYTVAVLANSSIAMDVELKEGAEAGRNPVLRVQVTKDGKPLLASHVTAELIKRELSDKELIKKYQDQLSEIQLDEKAIGADNPDLARLTMLDRHMYQQSGKSIFQKETKTVTLKPTKQKGVYSINLPVSREAERYSIRVLAYGVEGREPSTNFKRTRTIDVNVQAAKKKQEQDFNITDMFLLPLNICKPGALGKDSARRHKKVVGIRVRDKDGTPSTPREGTTLSVTTSPKGKKGVSDDIFFSKRLGVYFTVLDSTQGTIEVTANAKRGDVNKKRTEKFKIK